MKKIQTIPKRKKSLLQILCEPKVAGYVFILPFITGFLLFIALPMMLSFGFSFTRYNILESPVFIGLENYKNMFTSDPKFWKVFRVTMYYVLFSVPLRLIMALLVALLLVKSSRLSGLYRAVYYLPSIIGSSVAVAILWKRMFASDGVINALLKLIHIDSKVPWLGRTDTAIWVLILLAVWQFGSPMLIFIAGLKQIPNSYYEAASIDGANAWQKLIRITIPALTPILFFNFLMQTISGFMAFTESYLITEGGPFDKTLFYSVYLFEKAFAFYDMGYASALAWILLMIIGIFTVLIFKSSDYWVFYESKGD